MSKKIDKNDTDLKEAPKNISDFINGNTLDYYNDDLSRKAVGRLFEDRGDAAKKAADVPPETDAVDHEPSEDDVYVKGFERSKKPEKREVIKIVPEKTGREPMVKDTGKSEADGSEEDYDFDFTMYRKKERPKPTVGAKPVPARSHEPKTRKALGIDEKPGTKEKNPRYESSELNDFKEKYKSRELISSPKQPQLRKAGIGADSYADNTLPIDRIVVVGICLIFLVILFVLVFKFNSVNNELIKAREELSTVKSSNDKVDELTLANTALIEKNDSLQKDLDDLREQMRLAAVQPTGAPASSSNTQTSTPTPTQSGQTSSASDTYIVKQGDSFNKISKSIFGTEKYAADIMAANGYSAKNTNIQPGQVLKIPKIGG